MKLIHEYWADDASDTDMFCLAGPAGESARGTLPASARLVWTCEAESWFDAMVLYHAHQGWEDYKPMTDGEEWPYVDEFGRTDVPND